MIMKRALLVFASLLVGLKTASATDLNSRKIANDVDNTKRYHYTQPIIFSERGVEFLIFPDGSFDFNTNYNIARNNSKRNNINASYNTPRVNINYSSSTPRSISVSRDRNGIIRSIGDVYINYDRYGKVTKIGSVIVDYGRGKNATLTRVGGLKVNYNHWGEIVSIRGVVNQNNRFNDYRSNNNNSWVKTNKKPHYNYDDDFYYYKQNGKVKKHKKIK